MAIPIPHTEVLDCTEIGGVSRRYFFLENAALTFDEANEQCELINLNSNPGFVSTLATVDNPQTFNLIQQFLLLRSLIPPNRRFWIGLRRDEASSPNPDLHPQQFSFIGESPSGGSKDFFSDRGIAPWALDDEPNDFFLETACVIWEIVHTAPDQDVQGIATSHWRDNDCFESFETLCSQQCEVSDSPTTSPSSKPITSPTLLPTASPGASQPSFSPTIHPTFSPGVSPTVSPTFSPVSPPTVTDLNQDKSVQAVYYLLATVFVLVGIGLISKLLAIRKGLERSTEALEEHKNTPYTVPSKRNMGEEKPEFSIFEDPKQLL